MKKIIVVSGLIEKDTICCGQPNIHKTHFVTRGFEQVKRCDYTKTFAHVVKRRMLQILMALATKNNWPIFPHMSRWPFSMAIYVKKFSQPNYEVPYIETRRQSF